MAAVPRSRSANPAWNAAAPPAHHGGQRRGGAQTAEQVRSSSASGRRWAGFLSGGIGHRRFRIPPAGPDIPGQGSRPAGAGRSDGGRGKHRPAAGSGSGRITGRSGLTGPASRSGVSAGAPATASWHSGRLPGPGGQNIMRVLPSRRLAGMAGGPRWHSARPGRRARYRRRPRPWPARRQTAA